MLYDPKWKKPSDAPLTALVVLQRARDILENPENWTQGCWARTCEGSSIDAEHALATRFCIHGAIIAAAGSFSNPARLEAFYVLKRVCDYGQAFPGGWNDAPERKHGDILNLFDRAIAALD